MKLQCTPESFHAHGGHVQFMNTFVCIYFRMHPKSLFYVHSI